MSVSDKKIVINDSYFLTKLIFGCLRSAHTDVIELEIEPSTKSCLIAKLFSILFVKRVFPWFYILTFALIRFFSAKRNECYGLLLAVGVEDLSRISKIYSKYYNVDKLFYWQWNPSPKSNLLKKIDFTVRMKILKAAGFSIYTFDHEDSIKFKLSYYPQIYSRQLALKTKEPKELESNSVFFIGENKGRVNKLKLISGVIQKADLKSNIFIVKKHDEIIPNDTVGGFKFLSDYMNYNTYISMVNKSEYLLEVVQLGQQGLTLRTLEALFFGRKLITDNMSIDKYDFYNPANIYIIDYEKKESVIIDELKKFKLMNYEKIDFSVLNKYDVKSFFQHIINK